MLNHHEAMEGDIAGPYEEAYFTAATEARERAKREGPIAFMSAEDAQGVLVPGLMLAARRELTLQYSWSIPTREAICLLVQEGRIVDPLAGSGYWGWLAREEGADVVCSDLHPPGSGDEWHSAQKAWMPVRRADAVRTIRKHGDRTLLLAWPPYGSSLGARVVRAYHKAGGRRVFYVGEGLGGCCGDDEMFDLFEDHPYCSDGWGEEHDPGKCETCTAPHEQLFREVNRVTLPQWYGLHDDLVILDRA